jgi:hypothetical protein
MTLFDETTTGSQEAQTVTEAVTAPKTEDKTVIGRNYRGELSGETRATRYGKLWDISTYKTGRGTIVSVAQAVKDEGNGVVSYTMFGSDNANERLRLIEEPGTMTEKKCREVHSRALAIFEQKIEEMPKEAREEFQIKRGQVIKGEGYGADFQRKSAIYEVNGANNFRAVYLDGSETFHTSHLESIKNKFGIGHYYLPGEVIEESELDELVKKAQTAENEKAERIRVKAEAAKNARREAIARGAQIIKEVPAWAKAVIIGTLNKNESDPMTDYYGSSTEKIIFLAFSSHKRDLFAEMRQAAANAPETEHLSTPPNVEYYEGTDEKKPAADEHREKWSMGAGYYLGVGRYSNGWQVRKTTLVDLENLQLAAGEGRYFIPEGTAPEVADVKPVTVEAGALQVIDYSEKAIAIIGDTRPIKDTLKALGGRFNFRLTCGAGWIFPKSALPMLQEKLNLKAA